MLNNTRLMLKACDKLNLSYDILHRNGNFVKVKINDKEHFFVNNSVPLLSQSISKILIDKDYNYQLLHEVVSMPQNISYLSPFCDEKYHEYLEFKTIEEIKNNILEQFSLPVIVKKNKGSGGTNVFLCHSEEKIYSSVQAIFDINDKKCDYIAIAQEYINIKKEYRVVCLHHKLMLAYEKNIDNAVFQGNLSPLHWEGATAIKIEDEKLLNEISEFLAPIFTKIDLKYGGFDVVIDENDKLWLIEINSHPDFTIFTKFNDESIIIDLFKKLLLSLE